MQRFKVPPGYRRVITGGSIGAGGGGLTLGLDTELVRTDGHHAQVLVDFIDDKDVFVAPFHLEVPDHAIKSVKEVRSLATSTATLLGSAEAADRARAIASACRVFMREVKSDDPIVLNAALSALRAQVALAVGVLVRIFSLTPPTRLDIQEYRERTEAFVRWLMESA